MSAEYRTMESLNLQAHPLKVFVVTYLLFDMISPFEGSSKRECDSASPRRDTQPSPKS